MSYDDDNDQQGEWYDNSDDYSAVLNEFEVMELTEILIPPLESQLIVEKVILSEDDIDEGKYERPKDQQTV